ncbi:MAG: hypothetical protein ACR2IE_20150 [Candidatus Sumerlaeaceae bacterium]
MKKYIHPILCPVLVLLAAGCDNRSSQEKEPTVLAPAQGRVATPEPKVGVSAEPAAPPDPAAIAVDTTSSQPVPAATPEIAATPAPQADETTSSVAQTVPDGVPVTTITTLLASVPVIEPPPVVPDNQVTEPDPNKPQDTFDAASRTLVQRRPSSDDPAGRGVEFGDISGSPGEAFSIAVAGKNLQGAQVFLRGNGLYEELTPTGIDENAIIFGEGSQIPQIPFGKYDIIIVRSDGTKVLRPQSLTVHN